MNLGQVRDVMDIIQRGYGDSSMTSLDRVVAANVIQYFESRGWMGPEEVAHLVQAAGGEVIVTEEQLMEAPKPLYTQQDPINHSIIFRSVNVDISEAKVNPDAESRTVNSGPIKVSPVRGAEGRINVDTSDPMS